jgi:mannose-1-phosphate guanylyltransferase
VRVLLLAAGLGTRLRPITNKTPKCLVKINGKPLLEYWLDLLKDELIEKILINLHYMPNEVINYIQNSDMKSKIKTVYERKLLGTGGTVVSNRLFFKEAPLMIIHADNLTFFNLNKFINSYNERSKEIEILMMTFTTDDPRSCGILQLNKNGIVKEFYEKVKNPPGNIANAAVYIISPLVIKFMKNLGKDVIDFSTEVIPHFMGKIKTYHNNIYHRDIGTIKSLLKAEDEMKKISLK